ncbi:MAG: YfjI family protein [Chloroflexota bacterium]|nr:YfjI family protein [Chloroflexota bacterium]
MAEPARAVDPAVAAMLQRLEGGRATRPERHPTPLPPPWPKPLDAIYHGLAGDLVRAYDPHTEADPIAVLINYLAMFGSAAGRAPHCLVGESRHGANLFVILVGATSAGRKGTSEGPARRVVGGADPEWAARCTVSGLSSGEGLVWAVRDPIEKKEPIKEKGRVTGEYQTIVVDEGVEDKRLHVTEEEFASTLKVLRREGNTLSPTMRQAWDAKNLGIMTKGSPARSTDPHVSVVGHISRDELLRNLDSTEAAGGFFNRFLPVCVRRSKSLPEGGRVPEAEAADLIGRTASALDFARRTGRVERDEEARDLWEGVYRELSEERPGLLGAVTARAPAQVLRLSLDYALLDRSRLIRAEHLIAALALWDYCFASARHVFGDATGDPTADRILRDLRANGDKDKEDLIHLFGRHVKAAEIERATALLADAGLIESAKEDTGGRARTVWRATA